MHIPIYLNIIQTLDQLQKQLVVDEIALAITVDFAIIILYQFFYKCSVLIQNLMHVKKSLCTTIRSKSSKMLTRAGQSCSTSQLLEVRWVQLANESQSNVK